MEKKKSLPRIRSKRQTHKITKFKKLGNNFTMFNIQRIKIPKRENRGQGRYHKK